MGEITFARIVLKMVVEIFWIPKALSEFPWKNFQRSWPKIWQSNLLDANFSGANLAEVPQIGSYLGGKN